MATLTIVGDNGTDIQRLNPADVAVLPNTIQSAAGQTLTIKSIVGALVIGATGLTLAMGTGGADFSAGSGPFLTSGGSVTLGPGAISVTGNLTITAGNTLATTGSGNINLPNNASARFNIEGAAVSANVTAANLITLTGGGNADALHTHSGVSATALDLPGQTVWPTPVSGELGYLSSVDSTWARAKADSMSTARAGGVYQGTATTLLIGGRINILLEAGLNGSLVPASGQRIYVSAAVAGRGTNLAPSLAGQVRAKVALLIVAAGYDNTNGSVQSCLWQTEPPVQL